MIAPDANLLIFAMTPSSPFHAASRKWLEGILSESEPVGLPIFSVYGFLRFMTNSAIHPRPASLQQAMAYVDAWTERSHVRILYPGNRHWSILEMLGAETLLRGKKISDAAIAAVAFEYGATVHTHDRDFARFPSVRWFNPL